MKARQFYPADFVFAGERFDELEISPVHFNPKAGTVEVLNDVEEGDQRISAWSVYGRQEGIATHLKDLPSRGDALVFGLGVAGITQP